jgi:hypothetical protein
MANQKISELSAITVIDDADVLPIVDSIATETKKISVTQIKGLAPVQSVNGSTGSVSVQPTLVSGTNIKTINDESILGSGNITISGGGGSPSGVSGAIQFSDGSSFASDAANLFWDDTNNRLGIGTNAPSSSLEVSIPTTGTILTLNNLATPSQIFKISKPFSALNLFDIGTTATNFKIFDSYVRISVGAATTNFSISNNGNIGIGIAENSAVARVDIKGSGSTSATTALLVQNSAGTQNLNVKDNGEIVVGAANSGFKYRSGVGLDLGQVTSSGGGGWIVQMWDDEYSKRYAVFSANGVQFGDNLTGLTNTSAQLSADSTTKGFLPPRMTTTQKNAISTPASGLQVYDSTVNRASVYSTAWENVITEVNASPNSVSNIWSGSQAQYDALTPNASTLYFIV